MANKQQNCNIVLLQYNKQHNACEEIRQNKKPLTFDQARAEVQKNKKPLYFYVIGSNDSVFPHEEYNNKAKTEQRKIIND